MLNKLVAFLLLLLLAPFFLFISLLILIIDGYGPIFINERMGKNDSKFGCFKLQTLIPSKNMEKYNDPVQDKNRLTRFGRFLRNRGWDELPQLINILLGHMVFIGPRPLPESSRAKLLNENPSCTELINTWWYKRSKVLPGLSGWHQINLVDHNIIKYDTEWLLNPTFNKRIKIIISSVTILVLGKTFFFKTEIPITYEYILD